jgi:putative flippase GtrA
MLRVVAGLIEAGFHDIIIINDGSDPEHSAIFEEIGQLPECAVLTHPHNMGKGAALKTAFAFFRQNRQGKAGVITLDSDGQHLGDDVVRCALAMAESDEHIVMGVRDFRSSSVPWRNSIGNRSTALVFRLLFGVKLRDTQTGLRGIPASHIPLMLGIRGNRFEYETNMLLEIERRHIPFREVEIETVYEEGSNERSHFRPLVDSLIIFSRILKYATSSVMSFIVDIGMFWLALRALDSLLGTWSIPACTAIARAVSSFFNFNVNRRLVFQRKNAYGSHFWRYYTLAVVQMLVSAGVLWALALLFNETRAVWLLTLLKMLVDTTLFFLSYYVQRKWVFT